MPNTSSLTRVEEGAIVKAFFNGKAVGMAESEMLKILKNIPPKLHPKLIKSLAYLDKNNCLTRHSFEELAIRNRKHNLSLSNAYRLIKELDRQGILNQRNFDMIFKSGSSYNERVVWRHMMPSLIHIGFISQDNLDKLFLHNDFEALMSSFMLFVDYPSLHTTTCIDNLISQKELRNFRFIASFVPDAVWQSDKKVASIFNKLLQCNARLGNRHIEKNRTKMDYRNIEETVIHTLLDRCIDVGTSEEVVKLFAEQPRAYSVKEMFSVEGFRMLKESSFNRPVRSVDSSSVALIASESSFKKEIPAQSSAVNLTQSYSVNDTLLFGIYGISSVLQYFGFKNIPLVNTQPVVNVSAVDFKSKEINRIEEQLSAAEKKYVGNDNDSAIFSRP